MVKLTQTPVVAGAMDAAIRAGRQISAAAIRSGGRCTWVVDEVSSADGLRQIRGSTLGADLAHGTAGVGWFLAHLATSVADASFAAVAAEALLLALDHTETHLSEDGLGFYDGATGVAWAAWDAGGVIKHAELADRAESLSRKILELVHAGGKVSSSPALFGGDAGVVTGLVQLAAAFGVNAFLDAAIPATVKLASVADALVKHSLRGGPPYAANGRPFVGVAHGASGLALALLSFGDASGGSRALSAATQAIRAERAYFVEPGFWQAPGFHSVQGPVDWPSSWCTGATGIGQVRLVEYVIGGHVRSVAEIGAAIDIVRGALVTSESELVDTSMCHGISGWLDLLMNAGLALDEPKHLEAAARVGWSLLARLEPPAVTSSPRDSRGNPSLLLGEAGLGVTLMRLEDPLRTRNPMNPFAVEFTDRRRGPAARGLPLAGAALE